MLKHGCAATQQAQSCPMRPVSLCASQDPLSQWPCPCCSTLYALVKDGRRIHVGGLLQGFDAATWMVIALQVGAALEPLLSQLHRTPARHVCTHDAPLAFPARCGTLKCTQPLPTHPYTRKRHPPTHTRPSPAPGVWRPGHRHGGQVLRQHFEELCAGHLSHPHSAGSHPAVWPGTQGRSCLLLL